MESDGKDNKVIEKFMEGGRFKNTRRPEEGFNES